MNTAITPLPKKAVAIVFRDFKPLANGDGGQRRAQQIEDLLQKRGYETYEVLRPKQSLLKTTISILYFVVTGLADARRSDYSYFGLLRIGKNYLGVKQAVKNVDPELIAIEATDLLAAFIWAKRIKCKVEAYPHNVEAFVHPTVGSPANVRKALSRLHDEIVALKSVNEVRCITHEDRWLFCQFGISCNVLDYHSKQFETNPNLSKKVRSNWIIVLGTATNPPTRHGMRQILLNAPRLAGYRYKFVGKGTDLLNLEISRDDVDYLGRLDDKDLNELLACSKYAICYQQYGTGILTRIADLLSAGVIVLANHHAARGYGHKAGIKTFEDWTQLRELLA